MITPELIRALSPTLPPDRAAEIALTLGNAAQAAGINTRLRVAAFVSQLAHESAGFRYLSEIWGPTAAQRRYEGRADLGNLQPGDGYRYRGRGWIQLTGRANFRTYGRLLGLDLEGHPDLAARPDVAAQVAAAYWASRNLNRLADAGDVEGVTRGINGGVNGLADRQRLYSLALAVLPPDFPPVFLEDMAGKNTVWDGKPTIYNGTRLTRYPDGALQLKRTGEKDV